MLKNLMDAVFLENHDCEIVIKNTPKKIIVDFSVDYGDPQTMSHKATTALSTFLNKSTNQTMNDYEKKLISLLKRNKDDLIRIKRIDGNTYEIIAQKRLNTTKLTSELTKFLKA